METKKTPDTLRYRVFSSLFVVFVLDVNDFFSAVEAAVRANTMGTNHRAAVRASDETGDLEFEMGTAKTLRGFAGTTLWDSHGKSSFGTWKLYRD